METRMAKTLLQNTHSSPHTFINHGKKSRMETNMPTIKNKMNKKRKKEKKKNLFQEVLNTKIYFTFTSEDFCLDASSDLDT